MMPLSFALLRMLLGLVLTRLELIVATARDNIRAGDRPGCMRALLKGVDVFNVPARDRLCLGGRRLRVTDKDASGQAAVFKILAASAQWGTETWPDARLPRLSGLFAKVIMGDRNLRKACDQWDHEDGDISSWEKTLSRED